MANGQPSDGNGFHSNDYLDDFQETSIEVPPFDVPTNNARAWQERPLVKPTALPMRFENIPGQLTSINQWVLWRYEHKAGQKKPWTKVPYQPGGAKASATGAATWSSFDEVRAAYERGGFDGVGFVLTPDTGLIGVDMDNQRADDETWCEEVNVQIAALQTYGEISPSGRGARFFGFGTLPATGRKRGDFEVYDGARYLTLTGHQLTGTPDTVNECGAALLDFHARFIAAPVAPKPAPEAPQTPLDLDDAALIDKARRAKNGGAFDALWRGDTSAHRDDHSAADAALCSMLRFWAQGDAARMDALFRQSGLMRGKWDTRHRSDGATYGRITIEKAIAQGGDVYNPERGSVRPNPPKVARENTPTPQKSHGHKEGSETKKSHSDLLFDIAEAECDFFCDGLGEVYVTTQKGCGLTLRVRSMPFRSWLVRRFREIHGKTVGGNGALDAVIGLVCAIAVDNEREVHLRLCAQGDTLYYDLADKSGRVVRLRAQGWDILDSSPVRFIRPKGIKAQVEPRRGGNLSLLRPLVNVRDADFPLLLAWICAFFQPHGDRPHLSLNSGQGTAKSTLVNFLCSLLDPNGTKSRSQPKEERDLMIAGKANALLAFDNLSHLPIWLSDSLCRFTSGAGFATRRNYTDDEEELFALRRPVIFNSITEVATRPDLLDHVVQLELPIIEGNGRRTKEDVDAHFEEQRGLILGAIFDAVCAGLQNRSNVQVAELPRMADFALWIAACAPALGVTADSLLDAYATNRAELLAQAAASSTFISRLCIWLHRQDEHENGVRFDGTTTELFDYVSEFWKHSPNPKGSDWPQSAIAFGRALANLEPVLRQEWEIVRGKSNGQKTLRIRRAPSEKAGQKTGSDEGRIGSGYRPSDPVSDPATLASTSQSSQIGSEGGDNPGVFPSLTFRAKIEKRELRDEQEALKHPGGNMTGLSDPSDPDGCLTDEKLASESAHLNTDGDEV